MKYWIDQGKTTQKVTTQAGVRNVLVPLEQKVWLKAPWLRFPNMKGCWFSNTLFARVPSIHSDIDALMFMNGKGFNYVYPWKSKKQCPEALMSFIHDVDIPQMIVSDGGKELLLMKLATNTTFSRNLQSHTAHTKMLPKQAFVRTKRVHSKTLDRLVC